GWWVLAGAYGAWLGRRAETNPPIAKVLAAARFSPALPELRPGRILLNRLWPLAVMTVAAGALAFVFPQIPAIATGFRIIRALSWRRQEKAPVAVARAEATGEPRTFALTDLVQARAARRAAAAGIEEHSPRAILYSTTTAALLWPRPGAIHFDAPAAGNRPGRHGFWQRPVERRRFAQAPLVVAQDPGGLEEAPPHDEALVIPVPVEPSGPPEDDRPVAARTYAADAEKKGLARVLEAWATAQRDDEELVVAGLDGPPAGTSAPPGVRFAGLLEPDEYRALLRRTRVYVTAPRREDYGLAQLEALA